MMNISTINKIVMNLDLMEMMSTETALNKLIHAIATVKKSVIAAIFKVTTTKVIMTGTLITENVVMVDATIIAITDMRVLTKDTMTIEDASNMGLLEKTTLFV